MCVIRGSSYLLPNNHHFGISACDSSYVLSEYFKVGSAIMLYTRLTSSTGFLQSHHNHTAYFNSVVGADLFNVAHFRAKTRTTRILMKELLFADDNALVAHSAAEMQNIVDAFADASKKVGLKINITKTEGLYQTNSTRTREEDIMVDGNKLNSVLEFTYLGSSILNNGCIGDEIQRRMAKASASFGRLRQRF